MSDHPPLLESPEDNIGKPIPTQSEYIREEALLNIRCIVKDLQPIGINLPIDCY